MLISRPGGAVSGAPGGTPHGAPAQHGGGGSPAVQVNVQGPQMPYISTPQMPYVQAPQIPSVGGVYVQQPQIPQLQTPQLSIPQPSTPQATLSAGGGSSSSPNWLIFAIIGLVAFLLGLVVMLLLKK